MPDRIEREVRIEAGAGAVWRAITADGWLADEVVLELRPGGDARFRSAGETRTGWVEDVRVRERLAFWWAADGEPASRVELTLTERDGATRLRVVETRPLELLDLVGTPLPRIDGAVFGPAMVAA